MDPQKILDAKQLSDLSRLFLEYGPYFLGLVLLILGITLLWSGRDRRDVRAVGAVTLGLAAGVFVFALRDWSETRTLARAEVERARAEGRVLAEQEIAEERRRLADERDGLRRQLAEIDQLRDALREQLPYVHLRFHVADLPQIAGIQLPRDLEERNFRVMHQFDPADGSFAVLVFGPRPLSRDSLSMIFLRFAGAPRTNVVCLSDLTEAMAVEIIGEPVATPTGTIELLPVAYGIARDGTRTRLPCG